MSRQMDDQGLKPRPLCSRCGMKAAAWLVRTSGVPGLGAARVKMCTECARPFPGRQRRALKSSDY